LNSPTRTIVIVGGGFSGTVVAVNLLRHRKWGPARVVLVERTPRIAGGTAYADRGHRYLLNVPAGRMSARSAEPQEFLEFARQRVPGATADDFLPRALYGEYLESALLTAELSAPPDIRLERVHGEVCAMERVAGSSAHRLHLSDGRQLVADEVVLAFGNPVPASPKALEPILGSRRYAESPWDAPKSCRPGETVVIVGTGLTMADIAVASSNWANGDLTIHAISRHGLLPLPQTAFSHGSSTGSDSAALLREASFSTRRLVRAVRSLAKRSQTANGDWREVITLVRGIAPALWKRLPMRERRRFLRHVRSYWEIHRHRLPQQTLDQLSHLRSEGKLHVHAGQITGSVRKGDKIHITWKPRGADETTTLIVDRVINCTGPDYNPHRSRDPLMHSLLAQRIATSDKLNLGLRTGASGGLLDARGRENENVYYVGPQLRADHWEATAAQELRSHAERVAARLLRRVDLIKRPTVAEMLRLILRPTA
jgi:uncharacterized NAD(P)/FAD-binding protein YdhS